MFPKKNQSAVYSNSIILHRKQLNLSTETFIWMNFVNILTGILQNTKTHLIFEPNAIYLAGHDEDQLRVAQFKIEYIAFQEFKMIYVMKDQRTIHSYKPYTSIFYSKNYKDLYSKYRGTCLFVKDKLIKEQKQLQDQTGYLKDFDLENYESFVIAWVPKKKEQKISKLFQTWIAENNQSNTFTPKLELRPTINKEYFNDADPLQQIAMTYIDFILFYTENDVEQFQLQNKILIKLVDDGRKIQLKIYSSNLLYCQQAQQNINDFLNLQSLEIFNMELCDLCEDFEKFLFDLEGILKKKCSLPVRLYKLDSILSLAKEIDRKFDTQIQNYVYSLGFKQCLFYSKQRENTQASKAEIQLNNEQEIIGDVILVIIIPKLQIHITQFPVVQIFYSALNNQRQRLIYPEGIQKVICSSRHYFSILLVQNLFKNFINYYYNFLKPSISIGQEFKQFLIRTKIKSNQREYLIDLERNDE